MKSLARYIATALCAAAFSLSHAGPLPPDALQDQEKLGTWFSHFYQSPDLTSTPYAILAASKLGMFKGGARSFAYMGFITGVFSKYPEQAGDIASALAALPAEDQPAVIVGTWYSTAPTKKDILKSLSESMPVHKDKIIYLAENDSQSVFMLPVEDGNWVLDILWGYYFATGDLRCISRIVDALQFANDPASNKAAAADQAQWSLIVQGKLQPPVLAALRTEQTNRDPKTRVLLAAIEKQILSDDPPSKK